MLDDPDLLVLDVRRGKDWTSSEFKIKGATYAKPDAYDTWANTYPKDKKIVLYCA
jgi:rhodanese-related sulfurtransferase